MAIEPPPANASDPIRKSRARRLPPAFQGNVKFLRHRRAGREPVRLCLGAVPAIAPIFQYPHHPQPMNGSHEIFYWILPARSVMLRE